MEQAGIMYVEGMHVEEIVIALSERIFSTGSKIPEIDDETVSKTPVGHFIKQKQR